MKWLEKLWYKHLIGSVTPWSNEVITNSTLTITDYNSKFVEIIRARLGDAISLTATDKEVIQLYVDRHNHEHEVPDLKMIHGDVGQDGQIKVKLEWNDAFIRVLRTQGFEADNEEDLIRIYLANILTRARRSMDGEDGEEYEVPQPSQLEINQIVSQMDPKIKEQLKKAMQ